MKCARVGKSAGQVLVLVGEEILPTESRTRRRTLWNRGRRRVRKEELDRGTCLRKGFDRTPGSARGSTNQGRGPRIGRSGTSSASHGIDPPLSSIEDGTRDRPERTRANEEGGARPRSSHASKDRSNTAIHTVFRPGPGFQDRVHLPQSQHRMDPGSSSPRKVMHGMRCMERYVGTG